MESDAAQSLRQRPERLHAAAAVARARASDAASDDALTCEASGDADTLRSAPRAAAAFTRRTGVAGGSGGGASAVGADGRGSIAAAAAARARGCARA
jgi:hypothetical protein